MSSDAPLILYGNTMWTSPYVLSVFVALTEKRLPFRVEVVALDQGDHLRDGYPQLSLTARVPTLVDGTFALSESSAIVEYLDEKWPAKDGASLLPRDLQARARARQIMAWVRSDLMPIREERSSEYVFLPHQELSPLQPLSAAARASVAKLIAVAERLIPADGGPMFGSYSLADTDLAMMLQRLIKSNEPLPVRVRAFAESQWLRPSVQAFVSVARPPYRSST